MRGFTPIGPKIENSSLTNRPQGDIVIRQNKVGRMHPPHPQRSEGVNMVPCALGNAGRVVSLRVPGGIRAFVFRCVFSVQIVEGGASVLAV